MFPKIEPYKTEFLQVSNLHTLYVEQSGNPNGLPVVVLHGGPGAGSSPKMRQFFDPAFYRIIVFDQRGAGQSTPVGETRENTTAALVADIEQIRQHLQVEKWLVFGGSWGSTLAMAYGVQHPEACLGFILRGVFLMRPFELEWFFKTVRLFYPDLWNPLMTTLLADAENLKPDDLHYKHILQLIEEVLQSQDEARINAVLTQFGRFEENIMMLLPESVPKLDVAHVKTVAKLEHHFMQNNAHELDGLLQKLNRIVHLPCTIVQGRYDMVCPPITAFEVCQAWPGSKLQMMKNGGHSSLDPAVSDALVAATEAFKPLLASVDLK